MTPEQMAHLAKLYAPCPVDDLLSAVLACGFNPEAYLARYGDLGRAGLDSDGAFYHYLVWGRPEGRSVASPINPAALPALTRLPVADAALTRELAFQLLLAHMRADGHDGNWKDDLGDLLARVRPVGARPFLIIGDSHSNAYNSVINSDGVLRPPVQLLCSAGSAMGLSNPQSRSQYGVRILDYMKRNLAALQAGALPVYVKFGQVDVEFAWIYHRIRDGRIRYERGDFEDFAEQSVARYFAFLDQVVAVLGRSDILRVCSIFPPVLSDEAWGQGYVNAHVASLEGDRTPEDLAAGVRNIEVPNLAERTRLHLLYNDRLRFASRSVGIPFADDFTPLMAEWAVKPQFLAGHDGRDHHLSWPRIAPVTHSVVRDGDIEA